MTEPSPLRLVAEDAEDLKIVSAAVQDAVSKAGNLKYAPRQRRFSIELNRFRWEAVVRKPAQRERVRAILGFDGVLAVRSLGITRSDPELVVSLLQVAFRPAETPPGGQVVLTFAGDGEIVLDVEALDVTLLDSGYVWPTRHLPGHEKRRR